MTTSKAASRKSFERGSFVFHLSPETKKLTPCQVTGRNISSNRWDHWGIKLLTTGLGLCVHESQLFTGFEPNLPSEFWTDPENHSTWKYSLLKLEEAQDYGKVENLDPATDYGETDPYLGSEVYGAWVSSDEGLSDSDYSDLAEEYEQRSASESSKLEQSGESSDEDHLPFPELAQLELF